MGWFDVERTAGFKMEDGSLVPRIGSAIRMSMGAGRSYIVRHAIALIYEVKSLQSNKEYIVDLGKKTCNCFTFQSQGFSCVHAFKVILYRGEDYANYVQEWCTVFAYRKIYEQGILPPAASEDINGWRFLRVRGSIRLLGLRGGKIRTLRTSPVTLTTRWSLQIYVGLLGGLRKDEFGIIRR